MKTRKNGKTDRQKHIKHLDRLWSFAVKVRDKGIDQFTLIQKGVKKYGGNSHHIFSRSNMNTRFDTDNGIYVMGAHQWHEPHKHPELFRKFIVDKWFKSQEKFDSLFYRSTMKARFKGGDYAEIGIRLLGEIEQSISILPIDQQHKWRAELETITRTKVVREHRAKTKKPTRKERM